ncbi:hypothetical protein H0H87_007537 [Tephrocybe sp. NHM501043]|nr:hypothetical protein H0H87_007537 [Tephrocybe sp. NHM501043]
MASPFPFLPRTLAKAKRKPEPDSPQSSTSYTFTRHANLIPSKTTSAISSRAKYSNEDYVNLFGLALSDYALWADSDLRRTIDFNEHDSEDQREGHGFFPLSYFLSHSKVLGPLNLESLQVPIVKALRSDEKSIVEVRILVSEPSSSTWSSKRDKKRDAGAYEIRLKTMEGGTARDSMKYSKQGWESRTIYVVCLDILFETPLNLHGSQENIPAPYRTITAILHFTNALLMARHSPSPTRIQGIILPPHHQDKPGDPPTCKGFALIVLQDELDVAFLLETWRWDRQREANVEPAKQDPESRAEIHDATKFGFRALSKSAWNCLKDEYLSYRQRLVAEINTHQDAELATLTSTPAPPIAFASKFMPVEGPHPPPTSSKLEHTSPYPFDSLVFVRNIHPETNKTTLRKFCASAFAASLARNELKGDGLDYVDFNKGMDSCHLRLATPKHARILIDHFFTHPTTQERGLDEVGTYSDGTSLPVIMELVTGKREQLYWEKVPEKVRRQAVQKALELQQETLREDGNAEEQGTNIRKRQRRK